MSEFQVGDRVQEVCWGGQYAGTVNHVFDEGDVSVKWDHHWTEDQMSPNQIVLLERAGSRP